MPAAGLNGRELLDGDDRLAGRRGADHHVGLGNRFEQLVPRPRLAAPSPGHLGRPVRAAVDHGHAPGPLVLEVLERLLGHLAGADDQRPLVVEPLEDLLGEIGDRHAGNAHAALVDRRLAGHAFGGLQGRLKGRVQQRASGPFLGGRLVGLLHLGEDLRLADHHAVQAGGDRKQVLRRLVARPQTEVLDDRRRLQFVEPGEKGGQLRSARALGVLAGGVEFHAVAGGKQHGLHPGKLLAVSAQGPPGLVGVEGEPFAERDRRVVVAAPNNLEVHGPTPPCRVSPERTIASTITRNTKLTTV